MEEPARALWAARHSPGQTPGHWAPSHRLGCASSRRLHSRRLVSLFSDESQDLCLDDVLISDAFDRLLAIARKNGAIGSLDPQFHNYHHTPLLNM